MPNLPVRSSAVDPTTISRPDVETFRHVSRRADNPTLKTRELDTPEGQETRTENNALRESGGRALRHKISGFLRLSGKINTARTSTTGSLANGSESPSSQAGSTPATPLFTTHGTTFEMQKPNSSTSSLGLPHPPYAQHAGSSTDSLVTPSSSDAENSAGGARGSRGSRKRLLYHFKSAMRLSNKSSADSLQKGGLSGEVDMMSPVDELAVNPMEAASPEAIRAARRRGIIVLPKTDKPVIAVTQEQKSKIDRLQEVVLAGLLNYAHKYVKGEIRPEHVQYLRKAKLLAENAPVESVNPEDVQDGLQAAVRFFGSGSLVTHGKNGEPDAHVYNERAIRIYLSMHAGILKLYKAIEDIGQEDNIALPFQRLKGMMDDLDLDNNDALGGRSIKTLNDKNAPDKIIESFHADSPGNRNRNLDPANIPAEISEAMAAHVQKFVDGVNEIAHFVQNHCTNVDFVSGELTVPSGWANN